MHVQTHILAGWCVANLLPTTPRQRLAAMIASAAPDVDGLSLLWGREAYMDWHHTVGHNLWFAVILAIGLAVWTRRFAGTAVLCVAMVHLHLYMDYWGSGPDWHIHYLWPMPHPVWKNPQAWPFYSWQNMAALAAALVWTVAIAAFAGRTPLEAIMPRLDRQLVDRLHRQPPR